MRVVVSTCKPGRKGGVRDFVARANSNPGVEGVSRYEMVMCIQSKAEVVHQAGKPTGRVGACRPVDARKTRDPVLKECAQIPIRFDSIAEIHPKWNHPSDSV